MSDNNVGGGTKAFGSLAAFAAAYGTRRLITLAWKQLTGKEPPTDPHDPQVGIGEALIWGALMGVCIESARLLAIRLTSRKARQISGGSGL